MNRFLALMNAKGEKILSAKEQLMLRFNICSLPCPKDSGKGYNKQTSVQQCSGLVQCVAERQRTEQKVHGPQSLAM